MSLKISVADVIGETICISVEDGEKLYSVICDGLFSTDFLEVSFAGIGLIVAAFLHAAVGQLLEKFSKRDIQRRIRFTNLEPDDEKTIQLVIAHAVDYYNNRGAYDSVMREADE